VALGKLPEADLEGSEDAIFAEINITPLTDVFLVMLIIFMVAASAVLQKAHQERDQVQQKAQAQKRAGLKITLPSGSAQEIDLSKKSLVVSISKDNEIAINDQRIEAKDLDAVFANAFSVEKDTQVVIRADKGVAHGTVVAIMERAQRAGLTHLGIQTSGGP